VSPTTVRLGNILEERDMRDCADETVLSVYRDHGVVPKASRSDNFNKTPQDVSAYKLVLPSDVVVNKMKAWQGSLAVSRHRGIVSGDYLVSEVARTDLVEPGYLHYALRSSVVISEIRRLSTGIRPSQWRIYWDDFRNIEIVLPPIEKQRRIAAFLDAETERVNQLIAAKTLMVELLAERFESLLSERLQGHPSVPLKRAIEYREGPGIMAADFRDSGVPLIRVAGVTGERVTLDGCNFLDPEKVIERWSHFRLEAGDFVISASATMGTVALADGEAAGAVPYTGLIRIRPGDLHPNMEYIRYFLQSREFMKQIDLMKTGTAIQHYGPSHLDQVVVPLPSNEVQRKIADVLGEAALRRSQASDVLRQQVGLLDERRRSLITAAVTGEMEVR